MPSQDLKYFDGYEYTDRIETFGDDIVRVQVREDLRSIDECALSGILECKEHDAM